MTNILCFGRQRKVNAVQTCLSTEQLPATLLFDPIGSVRNESTRLVVVENDVTLMCEDAGFTQPLLAYVELNCLTSPRAESARAVTGRQCPHSGEGEDFLTGQPDFFTETALTPERKVEKLFPRSEINRHAEG